MRKPKFTFDPEKRDFSDGRSNGERALDAEEAVQVACIARGEQGTPDEDAARDLIADLAHLCDREGWNFVKIVATAKRDWRLER